LKLSPSVDGELIHQSPSGPPQEQSRRAFSFLKGLSVQILRDEMAVQAAIEAWPDPAMRQLLAERLSFYAQYDDLELGELFKLILIEPGDTLDDLDREFNGAFLINHYSGRRYGDPGFKPAFEVLEEYPGFYAMLFCESDAGFGIEVIVPKSTDIDPRLLSLCAQHATLAPPLTP
jgi:hypothetical protein